MSFSVSLKLDGDRELIRQLDRLPASVQRRVVRPAVRAALSPMNKAAKRKAPKVEGLLKKAIGIRVRSYPRSGVILGTVQVREGHGRLIDGKPRNPRFYVHLVERGTEHSAAQPFLRPAFDETKSIVMDTLRTKVAAGLTREATRKL